MKIERRAEFARRLGALPAAMKAEIRNAIQKSAEEMVETARRFVPVDQGDLKASIDWNFGAPTGGALASDARAAKADEGLVATISAGSSRAYYARFVEHGTTQKPARPFFYPAYRLTKKRAKARIARAVTAGAKKAFAK